MITNELNLPQPFVDAATSSHRYKPNRYSVTEVLGGTCEAVLKRRHAGEGDEDVSDRLWAILGTAVHKVLESAQSGPEQHQERWICVPIDNDGEQYELSGIPDLYDEATGTVTDWKVTSVWQVMLGDSEKWRGQLITYCWMLRQLGKHADNGEIVAMLRDHSQRKARFDKVYPQHPVHVRRWTFSEKDLSEAGGRVADWFLEVKAQEKLDDDELEPCSPEQRWHKDDRYAVMRRGQRKAVKLFDTWPQANEFMDWLSDQPSNKGRGLYIEKREGEDTRCKSYCSVAQFCPYGRNLSQSEPEVE